MTLKFDGWPRKTIGHLHASETWAPRPTSSNFYRLECNDWGMICWCYHQGLSQHAKSPGEDAAWWHGKGTPHTPMWNAAIVGRRFKKVQKLNLIGGCGCGHPKKAWTEGLSSAGLTVTHPSNKKSSSGRLRSTVRLVPPLHWGLIKSSIN